MTTLPPPENDYRALEQRSAGPPRRTVTVVIPVYERVALLRRTLAGLAAGAGYPPDLVDVVVADDGSTEDVGDAVAEASARLDIRMVRRERSGYGAGAARNLGAATSTSDVLLFLDADCLPVPDLIAAHMTWHHRSDRVVVIGSRRHVDSSDLDPARIATGAVDVRAIAGDDLEPDDWRRTLYRRSNRLAHGSEAYRAVVSNNLSVPRRWFEAVGGFSEQFTRWGGEDTELGWRLWQAGLFLVPEDRAAILHQGQEDGDRSWRERDRSANAALIASLVPHRFYRKDLTTPVAGVPKVSWVVASAAGARVTELVSQMQSQRVADWDACFPLDTPPAGGRIREIGDAAGGDGLRVVRAIAGSDAEYVAVVSGAAGLDPLLLDRTVRALDAAPRASIATVAITGAESAAAWSPFGMPPFVLTRRREWSKVLDRHAEPADAWDAVERISRRIHIAEPLLTLPPPATAAPPGVIPTVSPRTRAAEAARTGGPMRRLVYRVARSILRRRRRPGPEVIAVAHLGDARSRQAVAAACPWAALVDEGAVQGIILGGGLTVDAATADRFALLDSPRAERVVAGASLGPDPSAWQDILQSSAAVGLATAADVAAAAQVGISAMVIGHPADDPAAAARCLDALREGIS